MRLPSVRLQFVLELLCIAAAVSITGCGEYKPQSAAPPTEARTEPGEAKAEATGAKVEPADGGKPPADVRPKEDLAPAPYGQAPTDAECHRFAKELEKAVTRKDAATVSALVDWGAIVDRATVGLDVDPAVRVKFIEGLSSSPANAKDLLGGAISEVKDGGTYRLLRVRAVGDQKRLLFRLLPRTHSVSYHEFVLVRDPDGDIFAADLGSLTLGEMLSQSFRRTILAAIPEPERSAPAGFSQVDCDYLKCAEDVAQMEKAILDNGGAQVLEIYARLPDSLKKNKRILVLRTAAASTVGEKELDDAVQTFRSCFPDDPFPDLFTMGVYRTQKAYEKARTAADRLDKLLGGDPYLEVVRANTYLQENRYKEAKEHACKALEAEKDFWEAYRVQVQLAVLQKDPDEFARVIGAVERVFGPMIHDLSGLPGYEEFAKSPQYQAWLKRKRQAESPSDEECGQFAEAFLKAVESGDAAAVGQLIEWDTLLDRATAGIDAPPRARQAFVAAVKESVKKDNGTERELIDRVKKGGELKLLRVRTIDDQKRVLFRMTSREADLTYHEFVLVRNSAGNARAADIYDFNCGELASESMRRGYTSGIALALNKATQSESEYVQHLAELRQMAAGVKNGRPQETLDIYGRLPDSLKKDKSILGLRVEAAASVGDKEHEEAVSDFRSFHPQDPCVHLLSLRGHFAHARWGEARAALDEIDKAVGGDAYLEVLRAKTYLAEKQYDKALEHVRKAAAAEKGLLPVYEVRLDIALAKKDYDVVSRMLIRMEEELGVDVGDISKKRKYAGFVKSSQYRKWLKRERGKTTEKTP